jgi:hypothetical protein
VVLNPDPYENTKTDHPGLGERHGPTLSTTPEQWTLRLPSDHARKDHPFRGKTYDFP